MLLDIFSLLGLVALAQSIHTARPVWRWACEEGKCVKLRYDEKDRHIAKSLQACMLICGKYGTLWPIPTGEVHLGNRLVKTNIQSITVVTTNTGKCYALVKQATDRFKKNMLILASGKGHVRSKQNLVITMNIFQTNATRLKLTTNEGYKLVVQSTNDGQVRVNIEADTFFGARHGLETLSQLIIYDSIHNEAQILSSANITDKPEYTYRGLLLDTARNYYTVDSIKRTIDAMAAVKLNTFHWHITDTQSFPFVSKLRPDMSRIGAFSSEEVYTHNSIKSVVKYALARGVRVLPEFDAPAHVGEGWQDTNLTVCFNAQSWSNYCKEPPCGQLNPIKQEVYNVLEDIYKDMLDAFKPDLFHMGGDEVSNDCWSSSEEINNFIKEKQWSPDVSFLELWKYFQNNTQERLYKANDNKTIPLILWMSTLTDFNKVDNYLNKDDYIIQTWASADDPQIQGLLQKGYRLIVSNYDALYLDCGYGSWTSTGNNNCSPNIGWQKIYDNRLKKIAGEHKDLIIGGEAALWSEHSDSYSLDNKLWPRAAALAERLWAEPSTSSQDAHQRIMNVRERLVQMGIQADSISSSWCSQNDGFCT